MGGENSVESGRGEANTFARSWLGGEWLLLGGGVVTVGVVRGYCFQLKQMHFIEEECFFISFDLAHCQSGKIARCGRPYMAAKTNTGFRMRFEKVC